VSFLPGGQESADQNSILLEQVTGHGLQATGKQEPNRAAPESKTFQHGGTGEAEGEGRKVISKAKANPKPDQISKKRRR